MITVLLGNILEEENKMKALKDTLYTVVIGLILGIISSAGLLMVLNKLAEDFRIFL